MGKLIAIAVVAFAVIFVVQQSHLIETKKVFDSRLGVSKDETHINWDNLKDYFDGMKDQLKRWRTK